MRFDGTGIRVRCSKETGLWLAACLFVLQGCCAATQTAGAQQQIGISARNSPLTTEEIVEKMAAMNLRRSQALHSYHGTRTYRVEYRSVFGTKRAEMIVNVTYLAPSTKEFAVQSSTGSKLVIDKVFKKLLQAEEEAFTKDQQRNTALSWENYDFTLVGYESTPLHSTYTLAVEPKTKSKFLFCGKIWVDASEFAVVRIEAEPAKIPSFWTKSNKIEQTYKKVDDFWLPELNHSISSIRFGGRAEMTIEYQNYQITAAVPVGSAPAREVARLADSRRTLDCRKTALRLTNEAVACFSPERSIRNRHQLPDRSLLIPEQQTAATEGVSWQQERR